MKKIILPLIGVVVLLTAVVVIWTQMNTTDTVTPPVTPTVPTGTHTISDVTFTYPQTLGTSYIKEQDWPPVVALQEGSLNCATPTRAIMNRTYCVTMQSEGAAGSTYTTYSYTTAFETNKTVNITFVIRTPQCGNYDEPERAACEKERTIFDIDKMVDGIVKSIKVK